MLNPIIKFDTGLVIEVNENGYEIEMPDGECHEYDAYGMRKTRENDLLENIDGGEYIRSVPDKDFFVVSKMESGYFEEQKFELKKAVMWRVMGIDESEVVAISSESIGELKLGGIIGYENVVSILFQISMACLNSHISSVRALGCQFAKSQVRVQENTKVREAFPYVDDWNPKEIEDIKYLGLKTSNGIWLASRDLSIRDGKYFFGVNVLTNNGKLEAKCLNESHIAGGTDSKVASYDVFPVVGFSGFSRVISGDGSKERPFVLG